VRIPGGAFDVAAREVSLDHGEVVSLSARESDVLLHLARSPRQVFSREELLRAAFDAAEDEGLVDTYVHYLRRKLGRESVLTVRGVGYRLGRL
jgi:DNA-binding response OmpR family regulator